MSSTVGGRAAGHANAPTSAEAARAPNASAPRDTAVTNTDNEVADPGAAALLERHQALSGSRSTALVKLQASQPGGNLATNSSAERTATAPMTLGHADAGVTSSGDSVYAEVAFLKGHQSGLEWT